MKQQVNLYQPELRPRRVAFSATRMAQCLVLLVLAVAVLHGWLFLQIKPLRVMAAAKDAELSNAETRVASLRVEYPPPVLDRALTLKLEQRRAVLAESEEIALKLRSGAFGTIGGLSPYLAGFARRHVAGTWLTGIRVQSGGSGVALEGKTLLPELVPKYLERLAEESVFKGKTFTDLQLRALHDGLDEIGFAVSTAGIAPRDDS